MKYFRLVDSGIDVAPYLAEIKANWHLWDADTTRQQRVSKQRETKAISLRAHAPTAAEDTKFRAARPIGYVGKPSPMADQLPITSAWVDDFAASQNGRIGRAVMTMLQPNGIIYPHTDDGVYWLLRDRFHLVVESKSGSHFKAGGEEVWMQEGELWWFDPTVEHEAFNNSEDGRIHIILDVLSPGSVKTFGRRMIRHPRHRARAFAHFGVRALAWPIRDRLAA